VDTKIGPVLKTVAKPIYKFSPSCGPNTNRNSIEFTLLTQTWSMIKSSQAKLLQITPNVKILKGLGAIKLKEQIKSAPEWLNE